MLKYMASKFLTEWKKKFSNAYGRVVEWSGRMYDKLPQPVKLVLSSIRRSATLFISHDTASLGSGLSYYTVFSIAPMFIIVISITGSILGPDAVTGALKEQLQSLMGSGTADTIQTMVKSAYKPGKNWIATTLSIILLLTGAIGVFDQLRTSLNIIWDVKPVAKRPFWSYLMDRLFSFGMIACIAFLLLVSLLVNAAVAGLSGVLSSLLPVLSKILLSALEFVVSFGLTTMLFAFIYKFMSDIKMLWRNVFYGALFTAILFAIGKYLIGIYIGTSNIANTYGAASSVIVILLWVFYSSQIVFFGAEFTRVLAEERGVHIKGINAPPPPKP
jgi:membrane protein